MIPIIENFLGETTSELKVMFNTILHPIKEINDHTQNVLVSSLVTVMRQENILTDQICNHSTIFDIAEVNKVCTNYLRTILRLTLTEIGQ